MMRKPKILESLFILCCLFSSVQSKAQKTVSIEPTRVIYDKSEMRTFSLAYLPGSDGNILFNGNKSRKLKLPESKGQNGFASSAVYNGFLNPDPPIIYFTNIGTNDMMAYVDGNKNYDYTDDGDPVKVDASGKISLIFTSSNNKNIQSVTHFSMFPQDSFYTKFADELKTNYEDHFKGKQLLDKKYWLQEQIDNIKGTDVVIGQDSMCMIFIDRNEDGCYTSVGDEVGLFPFGTDSVFPGERGYGLMELTTDLVLGFKGKAYQVTTYFCNSLKLKPRPDMKPPFYLHNGDQVPEMNVKLLRGDSIALSSLEKKGKWTYIYFWSPTCEYCKQSTDQLKKVYETSSDTVNIISFSTESDLSKTKESANDQEMKWMVGIAGQKMDAVFQRGNLFPYGVLIDPDGKIVGFDINCFDIMYVIREYKK